MTLKTQAELADSKPYLGQHEPVNEAQGKGKGSGVYSRGEECGPD